MSMHVCIDLETEISREKEKERIYYYYCCFQAAAAVRLSLERMQGSPKK